jgi:hypothetical protein
VIGSSSIPRPSHCTNASIDFRDGTWWKQENAFDTTPVRLLHGAVDHSSAEIDKLVGASHWGFESSRFLRSGLTRIEYHQVALNQ